MSGVIHDTRSLYITQFVVRNEATMLREFLQNRRDDQESRVTGTLLKNRPMSDQNLTRIQIKLNGV
jgi:hypothetical protein